VKIVNNDYRKYALYKGMAINVPTHGIETCYYSREECGLPWYNVCPKVIVDELCAWIVSNSIEAFNKWPSEESLSEESKA